MDRPVRWQTMRYEDLHDPDSRFLVFELHRAAKEENSEVVQDILLKDVPVDSKNKRNGNAAIHSATANIHHDFDIISLLIARGSRSVDMVNHYQKTPLHLALERDNANPKVIKLLLDRGADVNKVNISNSSALHFAVQGTNCQVGVLDMLLERGAVVGATNVVGDTPLLRALRNPHCAKDIIEWLLQHGADIEGTNNFGRSVLHTVVENPSFDLDILKFLLKKNVPLDIRNSLNQTPLYKAIENRCDAAIVHSLLSAGAKIDLGESTIDVAINACSNSKSKVSRANLALLVRYATLNDSDFDVSHYVKSGFKSLMNFNKFCREDVLKMHLREIRPGATFHDFVTGKKRFSFNASSAEGEPYDLRRIFHFMEVDQYTMYTSVIKQRLDLQEECNNLRIHSEYPEPESKAIFLDVHSGARIARDLSADDVFNSMIAFHTAETCDECLGKS